MFGELICVFRYRSTLSLNVFYGGINGISKLCYSVYTRDNMDTRKIPSHKSNHC